MPNSECCPLAATDRAHNGHQRTCGANRAQRPGMSSLFASYIYEREGKAMLQEQHGFAIYSYPTSEVCYIEEIFVQREFRQTGLGGKMADKIADDAKTKGHKRLMGSVNLSTQGATTSMKVLLAYGFKLHSCAQNMIYLMKDLEA